MTLLLKRGEFIHSWIHQFPRNLLERTSDVKWIQVMSAGVDRLPDEILKNPVRIVTKSRLHEAPMGKVVLEMMLMFAKEPLPTCR